MADQPFTHPSDLTWGDLTLGNHGVTWWHPGTGTIGVLPPGATTRPPAEQPEPDPVDDVEVLRERFEAALATDERMARLLSRSSLASTRPAATVEAERRVLNRHAPMRWWLFEEGAIKRDEHGEPTDPLGVFCRACTLLRDEDAVLGMEDGYEVDEGTPVVGWPCVEVLDAAARLDVDVPAGLL